MRFRNVGRHPGSWSMSVRCVRIGPTGKAILTFPIVMSSGRPETSIPRKMRRYWPLLFKDLAAYRRINMPGFALWISCRSNTVLSRLRWISERSRMVLERHVASITNP